MGWMGTPRDDHKSMLYREWIAGELEMTRVPELLGSLGLAQTAEKEMGGSYEQLAHGAAHLALLHAVILNERGTGTLFYVLCDFLVESLIGMDSEKSRRRSRGIFKTQPTQRRNSRSKEVE